MEIIVLKLSVAFLIMSFVYGATRSNEDITRIGRIKRKLNILDRFMNGLVYLIFAFGYLTVFVCLIFGIMFIIEG